MNTDMHEYTMCTCGRNSQMKESKTGHIRKLSCGYNKLTAANHKTFRVTMWEQRALFHNLFE